MRASMRTREKKRNRDLGRKLLYLQTENLLSNLLCFLVIVKPEVVFYSNRDSFLIATLIITLHLERTPEKRLSPKNSFQMISLHKLL